LLQNTYIDVLIDSYVFYQLRPLRQGSQENLRTVIGNPSFFTCFSDRELREVPPAVACIAPGADVTDAYANLTTNQVCTLHLIEYDTYQNDT